MKKQTIKLMALLLAAVALITVLPFEADLFVAYAAEETEHVHTPGEKVYEGSHATCTEIGSGYWVVYCTECGKQLSKDWTMDLPRGHRTGNTIFNTYTKADDGTYYMVCSECGAIFNETDTLPDDYCKYCLSKHVLKLPQVIHNIFYFFQNLFGKA